MIVPKHRIGGCNLQLPMPSLPVDQVIPGVTD